VSMATAGVGMGLRECDRGLEITEILPNGPVHRAGKVRIGDILKKVDGKVVGETVSSAKELLIGLLGSPVTLTLLRHSPFGMPDAISVCVVRGSATIRGNILFIDTQIHTNAQTPTRPYNHAQKHRH